MSVQTNIDQYFRKKFKGIQNVNTKAQNFGLIEKKNVRKKLRGLKQSKEQSAKNSVKKPSSVNDPSLYCLAIYEDESSCCFNKSINDVQLTNTNVHSTLDLNETYISDISNHEEDTKIDVLSDCSIVYESINISNNKISTDKKEVIKCEEHVIKTTCIESKSLKRAVSPSHNDNNSRKASKTEFELSSKEAYQNKSIEEDSVILDTQYEVITNPRNDLFPQCNTPIKSFLNSPSKKATTFTPQKSSTKRVLPFNLESKNNSTLFFRTIVDRKLTITALENLNLVKEGAIQENNFDLETIYSSNSFTFKYNRVDTTVSMRYEYCDVVVPTETAAAHLFMIIVNVFSNPINCGYFNKEETDFIFSMLTLSVQAQMLLARMLKRKHSWYRVEHLTNKYKITDDLVPICKELVSKSFFTCNIENEKLSTFFKMLQIDEVRTICQILKLKVNKNNKEKLVQTLFKIATEKPLFPGMKSPGDKLRSLILNKLGYCISLTKKTVDIFNKILTLLIPNQDPQETIQDTYHMLLQVELGKIIFPKFSNKRYPIFSSKRQLNEYIKAKHELTNILNAIEKKQWETVRKIGKLAYNQWLTIMDSESTSLEDSMLPLHIRHFMPGYLWLKTLSKSIDAFKKVKLMLPFTIQILHTLIKQNCHMQSKKGTWYAELALIEMHHNKDLEASAKVVLESLKVENLSEFGTAEILERAKKLVKRKHLNNTTLNSIQTMLKSMENKFSCLPPKLTTVEAALVKENYETGRKKTKWCINNSTNYKSYSSVENVALDFYYHQGFNGGVHCEGSLPVTLFFVLFWEELYNIDVPGSFVTLYQKVPLDLFTQDFYKNRKETIDMKLQIVRNIDPESLSNLMQNKFKSCNHIESMMHTTLFTSNDIKDIVHCLGTDGVVGICERLIHNYTLWKSGFPDLIVWNSSNKNCKIIEVKGPGDKLSIKQTLWLQYLYQLGIDVEVCLIKDNQHGKT
ncbi:hypothetical protein KPH14_003369 [Odynerus spinipes]|uniref:Fanconi-associated nuclease n=1 Tax=Odynerus spinipes TaxID=1348599 RepID=A0AAD9RDA8_9HYME|nr:hypothetical protein KPH14_003369 [Odynerus spinipes]